MRAWRFEKLIWESRASVFGTEEAGPKPQRGASRDIESAFEEDSLEFLEDERLFALAREARDLLLGNWHLKVHTEDPVAELTWRDFRLRQAEDFEEELLRVAGLGEFDRACCAIYSAALEFDDFAIAALNARVVRIKGRP